MVLLRRAEPDDQQAIAAVIGRNTSALRQRYGRFKVVQLIESSFLSVVALDEEGAVVGFACFEDAPNVSGVEAEAFFTWLDDSGAAGVDVEIALSNTLFLTFFVATERAENEVADATLRTAFTTLPRADHALALQPSDLDPSAPLVAAVNDA